MRAQRAGAAALRRRVRPHRRGAAAGARPAGPSRVAADRATRARRAPRGRVTGGDRPRARARPGTPRTARLPSLAWRGDPGRRSPPARRCWCRCPAAGYLPAVACDDCRTPAPLPARAPARWQLRRRTGRRLPLVRPGPAAGYACPRCGGPRGCGQPVVGARRTAEELGRALPGVPVRTSGGDAGAGHGRRAGRRWWSPRRAPSRSPTGRLRRGAAARHLGAADPRRPARRRGGAAPLVGGRRAGPAGRRGRPRGGRSADGALPAVQALLRWDPAGLRRPRARAERRRRTCRRRPGWRR